MYYSTLNDIATATRPSTIQEQQQSKYDPCPCDCVEEQVIENWFLSETPSQDAIPLNITEKTVVCDVPPPEQTDADIDCETILNALQRGGYNLSGLSLSGCCTFGNCGERTLSSANEIPTPDQNSYKINPNTQGDKAKENNVAIMVGLGVIAGAVLTWLIKGKH